MDVAADMKQETLSLAIGLINKMIEVTFNDIFGRIKVEIVLISCFYESLPFIKETETRIEEECVEKDCAEEAVPACIFDGSLFFIPKTIKTTIICSDSSSC